MTAPDFWIASGHSLLSPDENGWLPITDDFLRAFFLRPEVRPIEESCDTERSLHAALLEDPRLTVSSEQLAQLADPDARETYQIVLSFRDALVSAGTLEACYLGLFRAGAIQLPPLFLDQMAHIILRHVLEPVRDPFRARAGELLFRAQRVTLLDGSAMLADEETVEMHAASGGAGGLGQLLREAETPMREIELDVLNDDNKEIYWARSDAFDTVLDLTFTRPGLDALCRVLEVWVAHFLRAEVRITPMQRIDDEHWSWHVGLDAEANAILNALYSGEAVEEERLARLLTLFRLEFLEPTQMRADLAGKPIYLGLAMDETSRVRLKPQNLLVNLPLAAVG